MKLIRIIGHPVLTMSLFLLISISGEAFGGPYLLYMILGLPHGTAYSILGVSGLIFIFISYKIYRGERKHWIKPLLGLVGLFLLLFSLYLFFANDRMRYNYGTFQQSVPMITLILFAISLMFYLVLNVKDLIALIGNPVSNSRNGFKSA